MLGTTRHLTGRLDVAKSCNFYGLQLRRVINSLPEPITRPIEARIYLSAILLNLAKLAKFAY